MHSIKLSHNLAVAPQIQPQDVADIAAAGYRVLINNRPDGEEVGQPTAAEIAAAAEAAGLACYHFPVTAHNFPGPDFDRMRALLDDDSQPVLAFCRTGTRCANLWVASRDAAERASAEQRAREAGFDLSMAGAYC